MPEQIDSGLELQKDIDRLKDPTPYKENYETEGARQLSQAIDILWRLQSATRRDASSVGYEKLRGATSYLERLLKEYFSRNE